VNSRNVVDTCIIGVGDGWEKDLNFFGIFPGLARSSFWLQYYENIGKDVRMVKVGA
jgi:hypothetical protein